MGSDQRREITRRAAIAAGLAAATAVALDGAGEPPSAGRESEAGPPTRSQPGRLPVVFAPHGGGPWPFVELGFPKRELDELAEYLRSLRLVPKAAPKALLVISAHWEAPVFTVTASKAPPLLYDYYGFPPESYALRWPAPGDPQLAARVRELLGQAGFATAGDDARGFDHGTFVPFKVTYPDAEIPTVQLSLRAGLDPGEHLAMGRALAPLRDEGVFILGSGMTFHNLRAFGDPRAVPVSEAFDAWLRAATTAEPSERDRQLAAWAEAPSARQAHPREEHLIPLLVAAGAALGDRGQVTYRGSMMGARLSAYQFG